MAAIANWYNNQYSTWNRTRRLQVAPYLARAETNTSRNAAAAATTAPPDVAIDMPNLVQDTDDKSNKDTLFGPSIGVVNSGPEWAQTTANSTGSDELTPEVVKHWIAKSKENSEPTTTLQALVNLKRPTIRLSPLAAAAASDDPDADSYHQHGLEFEYDCDAPRCGIYMYVVGVPGEDGAARMLVFESTVPGGFGRKLRLQEGAMLDLAKLEHARADAVAAAAGDADVPDVAAAGSASAPVSGAQARKKRLTFFRKRSHGHDRPAAGPALAVVDAETMPMPMPDKEGKVKIDADEGVKVTIRLAALDEQGKEMASPNEQVTYLHVVQLGAPPPTAMEGGEPVEDMRPWVVKVIKREAVIGSHTFHLHEIYGLAAHSAAPSCPLVPTAPIPDDAHTYPPTAPAVPHDTHDDEPTSECLLCLSAQREVVLLPCRHLVACRECALNMIEFGAGGTLVHAESDPPPAAEDTAAASADATPPGDTPAAAPEGGPAPAPAPPAPTRRKRKPKGWFCPVCRQPYTSMLRITTAAPPPQEKAADKRVSTSSSTELAVPPPAAAAEPRTLGLMPRPGFLRHFSRQGARGAAATDGAALPPDLERGLVAPAPVTA